MIGSARTHTDGVLAAVGAQVTAFDAEGPAQPHGQVPFAVVRTDAGTVQGRDLGSLGDPLAHMVTTVWITSVGVSREQAQWTADKVRAVMLGGSVTVAGRTVLQVSQSTSQPVQLDTAVEPSLFYQVAAFRLHTQ